MEYTVEIEHKSLKCKSRTAHVEICYPRSAESVRVVEVGLMDVRAADSIQIEYDFGRDGWVIKQASTFEWDGEDTVCDPDWQEVAFVQAWARDKREQDPS